MPASPALTDDVDAAIMQLTANAAAECVQHVGQVPAWAYVAAGASVVHAHVRCIDHHRH